LSEGCESPLTESICPETPPSSEAASESAGVEDFHSMFHTIGHDLSEEEIRVWLASDQNDPGYTHYTDEDIVSNIVQESRSLTNQMMMMSRKAFQLSAVLLQSRCLMNVFSGYRHKKRLQCTTFAWFKN
jgi:hypothetical protein